MARPGNVAEDSQLRKGVLELAVLAIVSTSRAPGAARLAAVVQTELDAARAQQPEPEPEEKP